MASFNIKQTRAQLEDLIKRAEKGEEIMLTRWNKPIGRLVAAEKSDNAVQGSNS
jgi:prevent-host-death family protein